MRPLDLHVGVVDESQRPELAFGLVLREIVRAYPRKAISRANSTIVLTLAQENPAEPIEPQIQTTRRTRASIVYVLAAASALDMLLPDPVTRGLALLQAGIAAGARALGVDEGAPIDHFVTRVDSTRRLSFVQPGIPALPLLTRDSYTHLRIAYPIDEEVKLILEAWASRLAELVSPKIAQSAGHAVSPTVFDTRWDVIDQRAFARACLLTPPRLGGCATRMELSMPFGFEPDAWRIGGSSPSQDLTS